MDFDGDGRRDIWSTTADVIASAANHLADLGWLGDQTWGREVTLPDNRTFNATVIGTDPTTDLALRVLTEPPASTG